MTDLHAQDPSMEEILASIRRIISEDLAEPTGEATDRDPAEDDDVLVLRDRAPLEPQAPEPQAHAAEPASEATPHPPEREPALAADPVQDGTSEGPPPGVASPASPAEPPSEASQPPALPPATDQALVDPGVTLGAAASFERLYHVVENPPPPAAVAVAVTASGPTLEDLTRDLLKPLIKTWLDENLEGIVRARVDEEIERISRGRVR